MLSAPISIRSNRCRRSPPSGNGANTSAAHSTACVWLFSWSSRQSWAPLTLPVLRDFPDLSTRIWAFSRKRHRPISPCSSDHYIGCQAGSYSAGDLLLFWFEFNEDGGALFLVSSCTGLYLCRLTETLLGSVIARSSAYTRMNGRLWGDKRSWRLWCPKSNSTLIESSPFTWACLIADDTSVICQSPFLFGDSVMLLSCEGTAAFGDVPFIMRCVMVSDWRCWRRHEDPRERRQAPGRWRAWSRKCRVDISITSESGIEVRLKRNTTLWWEISEIRH